MLLTLRVAAMAAGLIGLLPLHYLWVLAGRRSPWPRRFLAGVAWVAGLRVRTVGKPLQRDVLFLANHLSWLDIVAMAGATGAAFVSKDEVARWPAIGWLASLNDTIFIARADRGSVRGQADALGFALARGKPVLLFPEGTTGDGEALLPFRASLLAALFPAPAAIRVQPVAISYDEATRDIAWVGDESAPANARRILSRRGTLPVRLDFLEPIDPAGFADRKALAEAARVRIGQALASAGRSDAL